MHKIQKTQYQKLNIYLNANRKWKDNISKFKTENGNLTSIYLSKKNTKFKNKYRNLSISKNNNNIKINSNTTQ